MTDAESFDNLKALYHTFGCKLNFAETSAIASRLAARGIRRVTEDETPDIVVVNTCSVTGEADRKCARAIRSFHKRFPDAAIAVTGCFAQLKPNEVAALPGVAVVAGAGHKMKLDALIDNWLRTRTNLADVIPAKDIRDFAPSCSRGDRTRFFLKVQDGCDYWCTYCTIPKARGRSRSGTIDQLVAQAAEAAEAGGREIVITGVNIGDFGKGRSDTFLDLIRELDKVEGIARYRISSIEPNLLTDEVIDFTASSRAFMPHFHIPLQSGSDTVLSLMHRHYDTALFARKIARIRQAMPDSFIGVDLIVGARGETDALFAESKAFVESLPISRLHVFPYSERPGTKALEIEHIVSQAEKHKRTSEMLAVSESKWETFARSFEGTVRPVLLEHGKPGDNPMTGFTDNYLRVEVTGATIEMDNQIVDVRLGAPDPATETLSGTLA